MELQTFNNTQFGELRTAEIEGKIYYCATDVARALGYSNPHDAIKRHCKGVVKHEGVSITVNQYGTETRQSMEMAFIPEGDVYRLTARSKLPQAEKFESWVFDDILPQIAHTGSYSLPSTPEEKIDLLLEVAHNQKGKVKEIDERVTKIEKDQKIDPTQYGYIGSLVKKRVQEVKAVYKYSWNSSQVGALKHGINRDICNALDAHPRTQIRAHRFKEACDFITSWNPSSVTLKEIEELEEHV